MRKMFLKSMFSEIIKLFGNYFSWPLCCLSFFDLRILITPLVSSNSSQLHMMLIVVKIKQAMLDRKGIPPLSLLESFHIGEEGFLMSYSGGNL
jgi:hypothetical protein